MSTKFAAKPALSILGPRDMELGPFATGEAQQDGSPWANWRLRTDEDGVAWLLFDKKDASANTLSEETLTELNSVLDKVEHDRPRGLVIRSAKRSGFIAGADIAQFKGVTDTAPIEATLTKGHAVLDRLDKLPLPTIAVIHGYCLGGGLEVALACDFRIAAESAKLGDTSLKFGLIPDEGGAYFFPRFMGVDKALKMSLLSEVYTARQALELGLVTEVVADEELMARAHELAARLAEGPPIAIRVTKRMMYKQRSMQLDNALEDAAMATLVTNYTDDVKEGTAAFHEKRKPQFKGK